MRLFLAVAVLAALAGCSWKIPTAEQRAQLAEISAQVSTLTASLDAAAVEVKAVIDGVRDGTVSAADAAVRLAALYARRGEIEAQLSALKTAEKDLKAQGVNGFFVALSAVLGIASALLGTKYRAIGLVARGLSAVLAKAKDGQYVDGDTADALEKAGASKALAEKVRRAAG